MSWLSGKPRRVISLHWPKNDLVIQQFESRYEPLGSWSVLDDQVLRAFVVSEPNEVSSTVYLAKLHEIAGEENTAAFVKIAVLPNAVHRVALLPDRAGFVSLEFTKSISTVTLRTHSWDGTVSKETAAHAAAAYGDLVVNRHAIAVCISSGQPSPPELYLAGNPDVYHRVDAYSSPVPPEPRDLTGDHILVWMIESNTLKSSRIPQDEDVPLTHEASFQFVGDSHIALGGKVISSFGRPSALLKAFLVDDPDEFSRTFTHGDNFEMDDDLGIVATPGSSHQNAVLANYHHNGGRFTVVNNGLLSGDIESEPSSDEYSGVHAFHDHPRFSRTLEGFFNVSLPAISDNRLLVGLDIEFDHEGFKKFAVKRVHENDGKILFLYDFDQVRCKELYNLTAAGRTALESKLRKENPNAKVTVVQRNFYTSIEEEEDKEWPPWSQPPEWMEHLNELYHIGESRKKGRAEIPLLEFDEPPDALKGTPRMLFTRSAVWLPEETDNRCIDFHRLALTTSGIVHLSPPGKVGQFFCFP